MSQSETSFGVIRDIAGVKRPPLKSSHNRRLKNVNKFSELEVKENLNKIVVPANNRHVNNITPATLFNIFSASHGDSVSKIHDAEKLNKLVVELDTAEEIIVSSTISPNDMQDANPAFFIDDELTNIDQNTISNIRVYLEKYFNGSYKLGKKMKKWCREALFRSGAAVTILLPQSTLASIVKPVQANIKKLQGYENIILPPVDSKEEKNTIEYFDKVFSKDTYNHILNHSISTTNNTKRSFESINTNRPEEVSKRVSRVYPNIIDIVSNKLELNSDSKDYRDIKSCLEALTVNITTKIEDGDTIHITENPEILRFGSAVRDYTKRKKRFDIEKQYDTEFESDDTTSIEEPILDLSKFTDEYTSNKPFSLTVPTESIIPICMPGSRTEKLGYFLLVDDMGKPIDATSYVGNYVNNSTSRLIANSFTAVYGDNSAGTELSTNNGSNYISFSSQQRNQFNTHDKLLNEVFNYILDNKLKSKLRNMGENDVNFDEYQDIATCMFYRSLEYKKTTLVYIPEHYVTYVAFDYRENGAGKSLVEDIDFLAAMRAVALVSTLMSQMNNSIPRKELTINLSEDDIAADQIVEQTRNAYLDKYKLAFSSNPNVVATDMVSRNLGIKTVGDQTKGFSIEHNDTNNDVVKLDGDFTETIDKMISTKLKVPYGILNQLSENELAIGVATNNIVFSNTITNFQEILCDITTTHIRKYIEMSKDLKKGILRILGDDNTEASDDSNKSKKIIEGAKDINDKSINSTDMLDKVIKNVYISLPKPNIAPNKAIYETLRSQLEVIDGTINLMFDNGLLDSNTDSELTSILEVVKAFYKHNAVIEMGEKLGISSGLNIEPLKTFYLNNRDNILDMRKSLENLKNDITKDKAARNASDGDDDSGGGSSW